MSSPTMCTSTNTTELQRRDQHFKKNYSFSSLSRFILNFFFQRGYRPLLANLPGGGAAAAGLANWEVLYMKESLDSVMGGWGS